MLTWWHIIYLCLGLKQTVDWNLLQLKNGDLRVILLFEELLLLKEFEKRENLLQETLSSKLSDRDEMSDKVKWF